MCHPYAQLDKPVCMQHLPVNGCRGAFLHHTHIFSTSNELYGTLYQSMQLVPLITTQVGSICWMFT
ncbi:hypothetical protein Syun_023566 [Stephania yunnanensis]|uniref:Uncharacterized protein n=1 Tax=Stephania yunnanensis TaxID=152371 RepID=A0AAP0FCB2_9MAGN